MSRKMVHLLKVLIPVASIMFVFQVISVRHDLSEKTFYDQNGDWFKFVHPPDEQLKGFDGQIQSVDESVWQIMYSKNTSDKPTNSVKKEIAYHYNKTLEAFKTRQSETNLMKSVDNFEHDWRTDQNDSVAIVADVQEYSDPPNMTEPTVEFISNETEVMFENERNLNGKSHKELRYNTTNDKLSDDTNDYSNEGISKIFKNDYKNVIKVALGVVGFAVLVYGGIKLFKRFRQQRAGGEIMELVETTSSVFGGRNGPEPVLNMHVRYPCV